MYVDAIRLGFRDRTYAMPVVARALNIAWETTYAVQVLSAGVSVQGVINVVWALADVVIVVTYLRLGRGELPSGVTRPYFDGYHAAGERPARRPASTPAQ